MAPAAFGWTRGGPARSGVALGILAGMLAGSVLTAVVVAEDEPGPQAVSTATDGDDRGTGGDEPATANEPAPAPVAATGAPTTLPPTTTPSASGTAARPAAAPAAPAGDTRTAAATNGSPATCGGIAAAGVRGVTDTTIKIGFGIADISAFEAIGGPDMGDQEAYIRAHLAGWKRRGVLPVCGRDIVPVFRSYQILEPSTSRALCQGFMNDDKVFAVITQFSFLDPNCVTREHASVLMDHGVLLTQANFDASGGRLFSLNPPIDIQYRLWATWAHKRGYLDGRKVGVYFNNNNPDSERIIVDNLLAALKRYGHEPVVVTTNTQPTVAAQGDPNDSVAVQRFKTSGVQVMFLLAGGTNFHEEARDQGFRPLYVYSGVSAKDSTSKNFDPAYMDGSLGIIWEHMNEVSAGEPPTAGSELCNQHVDQAGMKRPKREEAQANGSLLSCDMIRILTLGLEAAGKNLTSDRLALGLETIKDYDSGYASPVTFRRGKHWGIDRNRESRYFKDCACWKVIGPFQALFLEG